MRSPVRSGRGLRRPLWPAGPPPGPARPAFWRSPLRGARLTTVLGLVLLAGVTIVAATGFVSHAAYQPDLGRNALIPRDGDFQPFVFAWPSTPAYLYAVTQGLHVTVGIVVVPVLLAKLWSVIPRLFAWPPVLGPAHAVERVGTLLLVGAAMFQFATGIADVQLYYPWHFDFVAAHYYGAWVFTSALVLHVAIKLPTMRRALGTRRELAGVLDAQLDLRAPDPDPPTISRRGLFALVGAASGSLLVVTVGQSAGGPLRGLALLAPRGTGEHFPVNKTARVARVTPRMTGGGWRLELDGRTPARLERAALEAMAQHTHDLPIACVEGWSTTQRWTGVRLTDLAALAGMPDARALDVTSLQPQGRFRRTTLGHAQIHDDRSLLALRVNGDDLSLDHGYPARIIVPALPGVHCTKWVGGLGFRA